MAQNAPTATKVFLQPPKPSRSIHKSIKPFIIIASCFGLFPVDGVTSNSVEDLNFRWFSLKTLYSFLLLLQAFSGSVLHFIDLFKKDASSTTLLSFCIYFVCLLTFAAYFYLASKWPKFIKEWHKVDLSMQRVYDYPSSLNAKFGFITITTFLTTSFYIIVTYRSNNQLISDTYVKIYTIIDTKYIPAQLLEALKLMNYVVTTSLWVINDTLIILISTALALRFKQITDRVLLHGINTQSLDFWSEIRADYIKLFELSQLINQYIPFQITLSFAINGWFILLDLFFVVKYSNTELNKDLIFCYIDLIWCFFTIIFTASYTAWVNDETKRFAATLNCVPPKNHNLAIKLLVEQMPLNPVALSGNNIFDCTRGLILNILGAVIAYELLLIQFSDVIVSR